MPKKRSKVQNQSTVLLKGEAALLHQHSLLEKINSKDLYKKMKNKPKYEIQYIVGEERDDHAIQLLYFKRGTKPAADVIVQKINQIHYLLWELIMRKDIHHESLRDLLEREEWIRDTISQRPLLNSWFTYWEKRRSEDIEMSSADSGLKEKINQTYDGSYKDFWLYAGTTLMHTSQSNGLEIIKVLNKYLDLDCEAALPDIEKQEMLMAYIPGCQQKRADVKVVASSSHTTVIRDALGVESRVKATELMGTEETGYHTLIKENPQAYHVQLKTDLSKDFFDRNPKKIILVSQNDKIMTRYNWQTKDIEIFTMQNALLQYIIAKIDEIELVKIGNTEVRDPLDMELVFKYGYECLSLIRRLTPFQKVVGYPNSIEPALQRYLLERVNPFMQSHGEDSVRLILSSRNQFIIDYYKNHQCTQFFQYALDSSFYMTCFEILENTRMPIDFERLCKTHPVQLQGLIFKEAQDPQEHVLADGNGSKMSARMIRVIRDKPELLPVSFKRFLDLYQRCPELIMTVFSTETSEDFYSSICELIKTAFSQKYPVSSVLTFLISYVKKYPKILESWSKDLQIQIEAYYLDQLEKTDPEPEPKKTELVVDKISFVDQKTLLGFRDKTTLLMTGVQTHLQNIYTFTERLSPSSHQWLTSQAAEKKDILQQHRPDNILPSLWTTWLSNSIDWLSTRKRLETLLSRLSEAVPSTLEPSYLRDLVRKEQSIAHKIQLDSLIMNQIESVLRESKGKKPTKKISQIKTAQKPRVTIPVEQPLTLQKKEKQVKPSQTMLERSQYPNIENLIKPFFDHEFAYCCGDEEVRHMLVIRFLVLLMETCFVIEERKMRKLINWSSVHYARNLYSHYAYFIERDKINFLINELAGIRHLFLAGSSFDSIQESLQNFIDTANELGNATLQKRYKARLFLRGEAITTSHQNTAQILYRMDDDRHKLREARYEEVVTQLAALDEKSTMSDAIKEKLLLVELGEHTKASEAISNNATEQFGEKKIHDAKLQRNKLLHQYATKALDEMDTPIKSTLMQDCRISEHSEYSLSLQGQGFFQDSLAEKVHTKLCLE